MYKNKFVNVCIAPKNFFELEKNTQTVDRSKNVEYNYVENSLRFA